MSKHWYLVQSEAQEKVQRHHDASTARETNAPVMGIWVQLTSWRQRKHHRLPTMPQIDALAQLKQRAQEKVKSEVLLRD